MSLKDKIFSLRKAPQTGTRKHGPLLYNAGLSNAAELAKEADELMERMVSVLKKYDDEEAMKVITEYNDWKERSEGENND